MKIVISFSVLLVALEPVLMQTYDYDGAEDGGDDWEGLLSHVAKLGQIEQIDYVDPIDGEVSITGGSESDF